MDTPNKRTVLIVDDEPAILEIYALTLRELGFEVVEALDGLEALERAATLNPALVLVDQLMPGMSGVEFIARVRKMGLRDVPIILVSAGRNLEALARDAGSTLVIEKPFEIKDLLSAVGRLALTSGLTGGLVSGYVA